jgi:2-hydroxychromene-2-carboxylate isomerase
MSLERKLRSLGLNLMFNKRVLSLSQRFADLRRKLSGDGHVVSVFLQLDDPYSYILSCYLPSLAAQYDITLRLYLSEAIGGDFQPAPDLLAEYAIQDCTRLATELGIPFLDKGDLPPTESRVHLTEATAVLEGTADFDRSLLDSLRTYWRGDASAARAAAGALQNLRQKKVVAESQALLQKLGHYNSAMMHYAGEWYWGVDRLHCLTARLDKLGVRNGAANDGKLSSIQQAMQVSLPVKPPTAARELPPIEYFYSVRSPYSYIGLPRIGEIADAFGLQLNIRPVLPMVMRAMKVPRTKLMYIAKDTYREARRKDIAFGKIADPVGLGTERTMAVYYYAESENKGREFLLNAGTAIWSQGIDVATDGGMRKVSARTGLFWPDVKEAMNDNGWRAKAGANRELMMSRGCWGVPTVQMGDFVAWGQDRDWQLIRYIEEHCDTGDGILV